MDLSYYKQGSREMRSVYSVTLGLVLLTVRAEKDSQGYYTEQTKGTTVTKDRLSKKENTIGHGTEAPPTQNAYRHAAAAVTAKIPEVASSATSPTPRLETIQMTHTKQRHKLLPSQKGSPTATRVYTQAGMIPNNEKIVLSAAQAAFESMMNNTSEPGVNLSTDAVKSSLWLHTPHVNRSQRGSDSIPLASADRGLPVLSASHPHVIDNLAALPHDNADKQAQGKDEKEISTPRRNKSPPATVQSIIHKPALSPTASSNSLSEGLAFDFQEFTTSYQGLRAESDRKQGEILNIGSGTSVTQNNTKEQSKLASPGETSVTVGPVLTNPTPHRSERKPEKNRERETFGKKVSTVPPHLKSHPSLTANFKNAFLLHRPLDVSSGSASNTPVIAEATRSTQKSVFHQASDHSAASHPTARMRLIEAHRTVVAFSFGKPTTSAVKDPESHSLTGSAASLISALRSQTPAKPSAQTKELTLTFLRKDAAIEFTSTATKTQDSPTFTTLNSIVQQPSVYPSGPAKNTAMEEPQFPTFTTPKTDAPLTLLSRSRQEPDDVASMLTLTPVLSKSSSGRLTLHRSSETQSNITQEKTLDATTSQFFARHNTGLSRGSQIVHDLKLGDESEQVWNLATEDQDAIEHSEETTVSKEKQKSQSEEDNESRNRTEELFTLDKLERGSEDRKRPNMEEHESDTTRENSGGITEEDAERKDNTMINTGNLTKDDAAPANPGECLTKEGAETRREETATEKDLLHNGKIGREDVTNVPPGATTDSEELNRDKGHSVINSSPCHSLIKRLEATEQKGIYLAGSTARNVEMKNKAFSYKVTSNHGQPHSSLRSRPTARPTEPYTQIKARPSPHGAVITKPGDTSSLTASAQNKVSQDTSPVTSIHRMVPKRTSGAGALKLGDAWEPAVSPRSRSTEWAHPLLNSFSNMTSLTAGLLKAQPRFTANGSALSLSIIYSISNHRRKFTPSVSKSDSLTQTTSGLEHIYDSRVKDTLTSNLTHDVNVSMSVPHHLHRDSSSRPLTAEASSKAHISTGRPQPHRGPSAVQTSQSSPAPSFDMTPGQKCSFQLSAHSHALHPPVDDNGQRSAQALMATMSPKAKHDQLSPSSVSVLLNSMLLGAGGSPGTYSLTAITRSGSEEEAAEDGYANNGSGHAESFLSLTEDSEKVTASSAVEHPDVVATQMQQSTDGAIGSSFMAQASRRGADSADDLSSASVSHTDKLAVENANDNDHNNPFNMDRTEAANKEVKSTLNNNHPSQLEGYNETSTQPVVFAIQTPHKTEQASEPLLPALRDLAASVPGPNDGAESAAFPEPDDLLPEMPRINANYAMTRAYFNAGSVAAEISGRQTSPPGSVDDSAAAVPQSPSRSDLKASNSSTHQPGDQVSDAASELQIITTTNNDFVSPAAGIKGPTSREPHELELTTSERVTGESFLVGPAERRVQINRTSGPGRRTSAQAAERGQRAPPGAPATTHPVTVHGFNAGPQGGKQAEPGKGTPQSANVSEAGFSPVTSASDFATVEKLTRENATRTTDRPSAKTLRAFVDVGHLTRGTAEKTRQRRSHTEAQRFNTTKVLSSQLHWTPFAGTDAETQAKAGADEGDGVQSAVRSVNAAPAQESGRRPEPELPAWKHRRRTPPHLYLSGVTEVSEDLCGSGNYTAEMSLNLGRDVEPGDAVPVLGNLRVVINLKTNNSLINLEVTSCCLSPTVQPDLTNSTCCLFSRLAAEPVGITLLPSALSTSASFTISLFQMINYSAVYLHCDLSVCLRNRSDCERECPERRSAFPAEGPDAIVTNLRNRISFGPMLKEVRNATFLEEIEPSELDLALVIVSLVVGSGLVTVTLLLVWLAYRRRAVWPLRPAAPPRACCGCMRPGGDFILP